MYKVQPTAGMHRASSIPAVNRYSILNGRFYAVSDQGGICSFRRRHF
jgi:hypothetical protein